MARIYPFRPLMYNRKKFDDLSAVLTQPYDKISPPMQARYYDLSPYNLVRIIKGKSLPEDTDAQNVYTRARQSFQDWFRNEILVQAPEPAFFAYFQEFNLPGSPNERRLRKGFIGLGKLEDYSAKIVFPHERTLTAPKADRAKLLQETRTHFESIFMLYSDPKRRIDAILDEESKTQPTFTALDEYHVTHSVWMVTRPETLSMMTSYMKDAPLIIADGHHRYETALAYRDRKRAENGGAAGTDDRTYDKVIMTFFNSEAPGLTILPTHRLVSNLKPSAVDRFLDRAKNFFEIQRFPFKDANEKGAQRNNFQAQLASHGELQPTIGAYIQRSGAFYLFTLRKDIPLEKYLRDVSSRQQKLDVVLLHQLLLRECLEITDEAIASEKNVEYLREFDAGFNAVEHGDAQICFFLNPTRMEQVRAIAFSGETLPQKSTDFYPKLLSGLVMYRLEE